MESPDQRIQFYQSPQLKAPVLLLSGPGTGRVGLRIINYLTEKLKAELLAEVGPGDFFYPPYSIVFEEGVVELVPVGPNMKELQNRFFYWESGKSHDLIFFEGNTNPLPGKVFDLAGYILDVAQSFGVRRVFMLGAFLTDIHHLTEPIVFGSVTDANLLEYLRSYSIPVVPPMNVPHNLNAAFMGVSKTRRLDAIALASQIPFYNAEGANYRGCRALIKMLCRILDIENLNLDDLNGDLLEEEIQIGHNLEELRGVTNERVSDFLQYLDMLHVQGEIGDESQGDPIHVQIELPESFKYIEELYARAKEDESNIPDFKAEVQRLDNLNRLLILRKYGDEILRLLGN